MQGPYATRNSLVFTVSAIVIALLSSCTAQSTTSSLVGESSPPITAVSEATTDPPTIWRPQPGTTWQWQLSGPVDTEVDADMFNVDLFETPNGVIESLHESGRTVVCYISAGAWEDFRPDAGEFPEVVLGEPNGWPGERWVDIRRLDILGPIMESRLDLCASQGFDGVEADNVDGYVNVTGFQLTAADQLAFNRFLADAAHARGLSIGLKNDMDQIATLEPYFDWAINEQCAEFDECGLLLPFIEADKAVFHVEYNLEPDEFCAATSALRFSSMKKRQELDAWRQYCP